MEPDETPDGPAGLAEALAADPEVVRAYATALRKQSLGQFELYAPGELEPGKFGAIAIPATLAPFLRIVLAQALPPIVAQVKAQIPGLVHQAIYVVDQRTDYDLSKFEKPLSDGLVSVLDTAVATFVG